MPQSRQTKKARLVSPPPKFKSENRIPKKSVTAQKQSSPSQKSRTLEKPTKPKIDKGKGVARENGEEITRINSLPKSFKLVAGSYEKLLYGLEGKFEDEDGTPSDTVTLKPIFIFPSHVSCVKAVATSPDGGKWLATGSTDEIIKIWDLRRRKEVGGLMQHEGSITYLGFPSRSHLVSASEDGTICIFRARDWVLLRSLKGHKGRVNCVAVHPSGKVGLSVGKDRTLRMWDLMRGKGSASTKIGKEGEIVRWSQNGDLFVVQYEKAIDVYSTNMSLLHTITHRSRVQDVRFVTKLKGEGELLLVAAEDKKVTIYDMSGATSTSIPILAELVGHTNRVKAMDALSISLPVSSSSPRKSTVILSTVSSDGWMRIYDLASVPSSSQDSDIVLIESIAAYDTKGTRLTCCSLADGETSVSGARTKRKRDTKESDEENDSDEEEGEPNEQSSDVDGEEDQNGGNSDEE